MINLTISCDDINPKPGWQLLETPAEKWFRKLNEEFGCKFTCFIPSCYHGQYPLSEHKSWINEMASIGWLELAAHGHYHQTSDPVRFGECEFAEIQDVDVAVQRLDLIWEEWEECDLLPIIGWRNPGWVCSEQSLKALHYLPLKYAAIHQQHNQNMKWNIKTFFGHDGIQETNIAIHNVNESNPDGMIMFQSHIAGDWNRNVWNEKNYEQLRHSLNHLFENHQIACKTLNECL